MVSYMTRAGPADWLVKLNARAELIVYFWITGLGLTMGRLKLNQTTSVECDCSPIEKPHFKQNLLLIAPVVP